MNAKEELLGLFSESLEKANFIKLILSKPLQKSADLKRVSLKMVELKAGKKVSFTYNYQSRDEVKNFSTTQSSEVVSELLENHFLEANLFTIDSHYMLLTNKKAVGKIMHNQLNSSVVSDLQHDKQKKRLLDANQPHWFLLGLTDQKGNILPSMQHKFKQVNKYIEILDGLIPSKEEKKEIHIADMGAGKGYLTFALYEYLSQRTDLKPFITGVELRPDLVKKTNDIAQKAGFENLKFELGSINDFKLPKTDILIALHACDTATDDAIAAGIMANAQLIVCAPCCHKQIRNEMKATADKLPMLKYGILYERQAEILTDTLRALLMEKHGYKSQIMEFIDAGHTPKNLLLTGTKSNKNIDIEAVDQKINQLKKEYSIKTHYLETALLDIK